MGIYPYFHPVQSAPGDEVLVDGRTCIMVGSNNYLGLVNHPKVKEASAEAARKYGSGCTGSRFLNGTLDLHLQLEERLAKFVHKEAAVCFSTGFQTNLGTISCLAGKNDAVIIDRQDHACIVDGARLSYGRTYKFAHNDMEDLERVVANVRNNSTRGGIMIVVDGVFSMEGDIIDLPNLVKIAKKYEARVLVDDAHAVGVLGPTGAGTAEHFGLVDDVDLIMGTFSKSFAALGGFVAGDAQVIEYIKHHARALIFSASITPASAAAVLAALDIIEQEPERREHLWRNARKMQNEFRRLGFDIGKSATPIVPIVVGEDLDCFAFWKELFDNGVFTNPVISPAVPPGKAMIRTSYTASHTDAQLDRVVEVIAKVGRKRGLIS
ncbi:MAG: pyridoxal phosphate-dependent aminotransferase family protein [Candidatus Zixiibacteriota bacterium]|nr:MAG: pyridoxal phosphate-dependent aminotransferase family protein [candidate division Zixibacteria bacterium]